MNGQKFKLVARPFWDYLPLAYAAYLDLGINELKAFWLAWDGYNGSNS